MSAARSGRPVKRDVLLGLTGMMMLVLVSGVVLEGPDSASALVSAGIAILACLVTMHWLVGGGV